MLSVVKKNCLYTLICASAALSTSAMASDINGSFSGRISAFTTYSMQSEAIIAADIAKPANFGYANSWNNAKMMGNMDINTANVWPNIAPAEQVLVAADIAKPANFGYTNSWN